MAGIDARRSGSRSAFTLVEVVVVMSLLVLFAGVIGFAFMRGGSQTIGLQGAQSTISGLLSLVRGQAAVSGRNAALFVNVDSGNPDRYLRFIVPVLRNEADDAWVPLTGGAYLSPGVYVVPSTAPSGTAIETGANWSSVRSTVLNTPSSFALLTTANESWSGVIFTPRGTILLPQGNLVVATGRLNPPGSSPPFVFVNPSDVRGVAVSNYGLVRLFNDSTGM